MLVRNGRRDRRLILAILGSLFLAPASVAAATETGAIRCIEDFLQTYQALHGYETELSKKEWDFQDGAPLHQERVALSFQRPNQIVFEYLNPGRTGIRNNGMKVSYRGGSRVRVQYGSTTGLGFIVRGAASMAYGDSLEIFDSKMVDGEVFTLNRAGFDFLATALRSHLRELKDGQAGDLESEVMPGRCTVHFRPSAHPSREVELEPSTDIREIEETAGTLASFIFQLNRNRFRSFADLFHRQARMKLQIPTEFPQFDLAIDSTTKLPERFVLYFKGKAVGDYEFRHTRSH